MNLQLYKKVTLITGSTRGIGRAIALRLAREGSSVILNASKPTKEARKVLSELPKKNGQQHLFLPADISSPKEIAGMMKEINKRYRRLDILVNNAGRTHFIKHKKLEGLTQSIFDEIYETHLRGAFICVEKGLPMLKKSKNALVVNIASIAAISAVGSNIAYCAMKAALVNMTMSLARALAPGIRVNAISPGLTETGLIEGWKDYTREQLVKTPLSRLGTCEDIADAVFALAAFLKYTTGQNIVVDGGRLLES